MEVQVRDGRECGWMGQFMGVRVVGIRRRVEVGTEGVCELEPLSKTSLYPMPATKSVTRGCAAAAAVRLGAHGACGACGADSVNSLRKMGALIAASVRIHVASQSEGASRPVVKEAAAADSARVPSSSEQRTTQ